MPLPSMTKPCAVRTSYSSLLRQTTRPYNIDDGNRRNHTGRYASPENSHSGEKHQTGSIRKIPDQSGHSVRTDLLNNQQTNVPYASALSDIILSNGEGLCKSKKNAPKFRSSFIRHIRLKFAFGTHFFVNSTKPIQKIHTLARTSLMFFARSAEK